MAMRYSDYWRGGGERDGKLRPYTHLLNHCRVDVSPTDVSLTESSWMLRPLNKLSLGYYASDRFVPTLDHVTHGSHKAGSTAAICLPIGYR